jgi:hypothetical protein
LLLRRPISSILLTLVSFNSLVFSSVSQTTRTQRVISALLVLTLRSELLNSKARPSSCRL